MMPESERSVQEQLADALAAALDATAGELARQTPRQPITAVSPEVVDAVKLLAQLARRAERWPELCLQALEGTVDRGQWALLANVLGSAAGACGRLADDARVVEGSTEA
jgi:predicted transcriptional regulator